MKYMKKVVSACLIASSIYVVVAITFQIITGEELSPTLTECFLRGVIGELAVTAIIKVGEGWIDSWRIKHMKDRQDDDLYPEPYEGGYDGSPAYDTIHFDENAGE